MSINEPDARVAAQPAPSPSVEPKRLRGPPLVSLAVEAFADAVVSVPVGATEPRPIVIAVHGNYDRPEWQCGTWRAILGDRAFVLCPRGIARSDSPSADDVRFTFANGVEMAKELDAGLAALRARWPEFASTGPILYTGFSLGAITGVAWITKDPSRAPVAVLTEGSQAQWTPAALATFAKKGGKRILFACGQPSCVTMSTTVANVMKKAGVEAKVVYGKGVGHGYGGAVAEAIAVELAWILEPLGPAAQDP